MEKNFFSLKIKFLIIWDKNALSFLLLFFYSFQWVVVRSVTFLGLLNCFRQTSQATKQLSYQELSWRFATKNMPISFISRKDYNHTRNELIRLLGLVKEDEKIYLLETV